MIARSLTLILNLKIIIVVVAFALDAISSTQLANLNGLLDT